MNLEELIHFMEAGVPFNRVLGVKVLHAEKGVAHVEVPYRPELVGDPMRPALHGGVLSALADAAGGLAVWAGANDARARVSTVDLRVDYLRPAKLETVHAEARVIRQGSRIGVVDVRLYHPAAGDVTIATGKAVYNIIKVKSE